MNVLFNVNLGERLSGPEAVLTTFLRHVDRERFDVGCVVYEGALGDELRALGARVWPLAPARLRDLPGTARNVAQLATILRSERPELVVHFLAKAQLYGAPAAVLAGMARRSVWWQHDLPGRRLSERVAALMPTRGIAACSEAVADAERRLWPHRACTAIPPGIDAAPSPGPRDLERLRDHHGVPSDRPVVGIVGRLIPWKGQAQFVDAVGMLRARGVPVHGLIVGSDAYGLAPDFPGRLRQRIAELGLTDAVTLTGHVDDATPFYRLMDVCVNASAEEPFGIVLLEAMSQEVPVLAVNAAGPAEIIEAGSSGVLIDDNRPATLADGLERLLRDATLRRALARGGYDRYRARFTGERMTRAIETWLSTFAVG